MSLSRLSAFRVSHCQNCLKGAGQYLSPTMRNDTEDCVQQVCSVWDYSISLNLFLNNDIAGTLTLGWFVADIQNSEIAWTSRWDTYLMMVDGHIHWFAIVNSLMIVLFLSGMVAMILLRTLHRDIAAYNEMQTTEEAMEETGWKLVS